MNFRLYHYWRSSSSWRVRWAMALKGIESEYVAVSLLNGEAEAEEHRKKNPLGYVPVLECLDEKNPDRRFLTESVAILEFLEETFPTPPLLPSDPFLRAKVRSLVEVINADTQPLQNPSALIYFVPSSDPEHGVKRKAIAQHWIRNGFEAYEKLASHFAGKFSCGDSLTLADLALIPQCYNAIRNDVSLERFPTILRVYENALKTESYALSEPEKFKPPVSIV